jgi:hypothetical protein
MLLFERHNMDLRNVWKANTSRVLPSSSASMIMKKHGRSWSAMPTAMQEQYEARVVFARAQSQQDLQSAQDDARSVVAVEEARQERDQNLIASSLPRIWSP